MPFFGKAAIKAGWQVSHENAAAFLWKPVVKEAHSGTNGYIHATAAEDQNARMVKFLT